MKMTGQLERFASRWGENDAKPRGGDRRCAITG